MPKTSRRALRPISGRTAARVLNPIIIITEPTGEQREVICPAGPDVDPDMPTHGPGSRPGKPASRRSRMRAAETETLIEEARAELMGRRFWHTVRPHHKVRPGLVVADPGRLKSS
jgi:hypothetical protein